MQVRGDGDARPGGPEPRHLETLRLHGLSDRDILDAVEVISYFNYINRVADALGIDPEPEMRAGATKSGMRTRKKADPQMRCQVSGVRCQFPSVNCKVLLAPDT